ncbi:MAG: secretin N-terminal domain-containing protein [Candidatus Omnitrophota bacterium]
MKNFRFFILGVFIILLMTSLASAQNPRQIDFTSVPSVAETNSILPNDKITLNFQDININEIFKLLAQKSGKQIKISPQISGRVTVAINNLSFTDALDVIVAMQNLAYDTKGGIVNVMTAVEYEKLYGKKFSQQKQMRAFKLTYAKPINILNIINTLKSEEGKIILDETTGTILVMDNDKTTQMIAQVIAELDQPLGMVVFDVNYARFADIKSFLNDLITPGVGQIILDERSLKVMVYDLPTRLERIKKLMAEFDEQSRQVLITGEILEVNVDDSFESGIEWDKIFREAKMDNLELTGKFPADPELTDLTGYGKINVGELVTNSYNVIMKLLSGYGNTKVLTRPRMVIVNKEEGKILVGTREAYVNSSQSQSESTTVTSDNVQFVDVGLKLGVVPTIGADGFITMKIKPEISSVKEYLTTSNGKVPIVQTSQAETVVKIKDGNTLVIGGLLKNTDERKSSGLPFISRIPVLGVLFGSQNKSKEKTELVIFITPTIITGASNIGREVKNENK